MVSFIYKEYPMRQRTIVCPLIQNDGCLFAVVKWPTIAAFSRSMGAFGWRRGVWRTKIEEALRREIREELGGTAAFDRNHAVDLQR